MWDAVWQVFFHKSPAQVINQWAKPISNALVFPAVTKCHCTDIAVASVC